MTVEELSSLVVVVAAPAANLFPLLYTWWKNWWHSPEGRHLFFFVTGLAALIDLSLIRRWAGHFDLYDELFLVVLVVICYQLYRRLWLLIKYNGRRARDGRAAYQVRT